jgi:hypothetical protein
MFCFFFLLVKIYLGQNLWQDCVVPYHGMKTFRGIRGISSLTLKVGIRDEPSTSRLSALHPGKTPQYPLGPIAGLDILEERKAVLSVFERQTFLPVS